MMVVEQTRLHFELPFRVEHMIEVGLSRPILQDSMPIVTGFHK